MAILGMDGFSFVPVNGLRFTVFSLRFKSGRMTRREWLQKITKIRFYRLGCGLAALGHFAANRSAEFGLN